MSSFTCSSLIMICAAADSGSTSSQVFFDRRNRHSWLSQHKGVQQNVKEFKVLGHMHDTIRKERPRPRAFERTRQSPVFQLQTQRERWTEESNRLNAESGPSTYPANRDFRGHVRGKREAVPPGFFCTFLHIFEFFVRFSRRKRVMYERIYNQFPTNDSGCR
jgi:hypothetical protein